MNCKTNCKTAINDTGLFLDARGKQAEGLGWTAGDLFDVPRDGRPGALVWFCAGEPVRALGPEHAVTTSGRVFAKLGAIEEGMTSERTNRKSGT